MVYIYVDDNPNSQISDATICCSYYGAISAIMKHYYLGNDIILDLGQEKTGYDICKFIVKNNIPLYGFRIHSKNPIGVYTIRQLFTHYGYKEIE